MKNDSRVTNQQSRSGSGNGLYEAAAEIFSAIWEEGYSMLKAAERPDSRLLDLFDSLALVKFLKGRAITCEKEEQLLQRILSDYADACINGGALDPCREAIQLVKQKLTSRTIKLLLGGKKT